jgi:hypothetical protein
LAIQPEQPAQTVENANEISLIDFDDSPIIASTGQGRGETLGGRESFCLIDFDDDGASPMHHHDSQRGLVALKPSDDLLCLDNPSLGLLSLNADDNDGQGDTNSEDGLDAPAASINTELWHGVDAYTAPVDAAHDPNGSVPSSPKSHVQPFVDDDLDAVESLFDAERQSGWAFFSC